MKKVHLAILVSSLILTILSVYTIAVINLIYNVPFEWYSKVSEGFHSEQRNTNFYEVTRDNKINPIFEVIRGNDSNGIGIKRMRSLGNLDFEKYIYLYCSLAEVTQNDANIKFKEMAQRGNIIEVIASINMSTEEIGDNLLFPEDIARIDKRLIINKGKIYFVFKNQHGARLSDIEINILK